MPRSSGGMSGCWRVKPLHVQLVDDGVVPRHLRRLVVAPRERVVDDHRARHVRRGVAGRCRRRRRGARRSRPRSPARTGRRAACPGCGTARAPGRTGRRRGSRSAGPGRRRAGSRARRGRSDSSSGMRVSWPSPSNRQTLTPRRGRRPEREVDAVAVPVRAERERVARARRDPGARPARRSVPRAARAGLYWAPRDSQLTQGNDPGCGLVAQPLAGAQIRGSRRRSTVALRRPSEVNERLTEPRSAGNQGGRLRPARPSDSLVPGDADSRRRAATVRPGATRIRPRLPLRAVRLRVPPPPPPQARAALARSRRRGRRAVRAALVASARRSSSAGVTPHDQRQWPSPAARAATGGSVAAARSGSGGSDASRCRATATFPSPAARPAPGRPARRPARRRPRSRSASSTSTPVQKYRHGRRRRHRHGAHLRRRDPHQQPRRSTARPAITVTHRVDRQDLRRQGRRHRPDARTSR